MKTHRKIKSKSIKPAVKKNRAALNRTKSSLRLKKAASNKTKTGDSTKKPAVRSKKPAAKTVITPDKKGNKLFDLKDSKTYTSGLITKSNFPIVGIGASAGGLAAMETFFSNIPPDVKTGMAFVVVQHLAPDHKSILDELIKKYTAMQVYQVKDGVKVKPDCVYIIPPNRDMAFIDGTLQLLKRDNLSGRRLSIDFFFHSLARDLQQRAISIILSGTGSDGTEGARAIKNEGGMVMAQNPKTTEFDGMPRSVINSGVVDFILPPEEMPARLISYVYHSYTQMVKKIPVLENKTEDILKKIFVLLRARTGHDFSLYKQNTIARRIERRMAVHQIKEINEYLQYIQKNREEIDFLFRDLLIGVTCFFRDKEAFYSLETEIIPELFENKPANSLLRVWIAGCSTGEEAYTIAILLKEQQEKLKKSFQLQIFATDIDRKAIQIARKGTYSEKITADVSPERLTRFFIHDPKGSVYRIHKDIRDMLIFSEHNVIKDPPFSKLDLISCRNVLIYFGSELQKKLLPLFHYSLNPDGYLFLGTSESIGDFVYLFSAIDVKSKTYKLKEDSSHMKKKGISKFIPNSNMDNKTPGSEVTLPGNTNKKVKISYREVAEHELLKHYTPACVIINKAGEVQYFYGRTGLYLEPSPGESNMNVFKMAREGLKIELNAAFQKVLLGGKTVLVPGVRVKTNGDYSIINLTISSISFDQKGDPSEELFMVVFQQLPDSAGFRDGAKVKKTRPGSSSSGEVEKLKQELIEKENYLQSTLTAVEISNEELKSINEELQSVNEEFQSTNEELETSREELQSVNEELATVNSELQLKVSDLTRSYNDMNNLLAGTDIGTIFVDNKLIIQRFTPAVINVINLIPTDIGRPISHIVSNLVDYDSLIEDIQSVKESLIPKEVEVETKSGTWYVLRIRPYRTMDNIIEGVVITFFDISEIIIARSTIKESENMRHLAVVVQDSSDAIIARDLDGKIITWNRTAEKFYGWNEREALTMNVSKLIPEEFQDEEKSVLKNLMNTDEFQPYRTKRITKNKEIVDVIITVTALLNNDGSVYAVSSSERMIAAKQ